MGFWSQIGSIFKRSSLENPSTPLSSPAAWLFDAFGGAKTQSGVSVNDKTALSHSAVYACCKVLSDSIASLPLEVYRQLPNGNTELAIDHPVHRLVNTAPSPLYTSYNFRAAAQLHIGIRGNAYAKILRDGWGRPTELRLLAPNTVTPFFDKNEKLYYRVEGEPLVLTPDEVVHVAGLSWDGINGRSPIEAARETIGMGLAATQYGAKIFGSGTHLSGVLETPNILTNEQVNSIASGWKNRYSGVSNAGGVAVLQNGMKFNPISLTPTDSRFIEAQKLGIADIARIYRVPLHMIGELDRATFSNIEQQSIEFVQHTIRPLVKAWEQELNRKLFRPSEQGQYFVRFNLNALLRGDMKARSEFYRAMFNMRAMSPNEIRQYEGMNAYQGGDEYYLQINLSSNPDPQLDNTNAGNGGAQTDTNGATQATN